jgi:hypothetical protein
MSPAPPLGSWWMDHLQLPGYDPIATAGPSRFDPRAAEQALGFFIQLLSSPLSRWEEAIILNLWGWRQAQGQRRYVTVYAEPYRQDVLALWCATLGLWVLRAAPPRRAPQVTVSYAQAPLRAEVSTWVAATLAPTSAWGAGLLLDPGRHAVQTPQGGTLTLACAAELCLGEVLLHREGGQPLTLAVATRDAEPSPMVAPIAQAARQALAGEPVPVLPAVM